MTAPSRPDPGPRWRRRPEARPEEILEAAVGVFGELGFARATLADVARRAGVSKGTVYLYFDSKETLFREMVRIKIVSVFAAEVGAPPRDDEPAREALTSLISKMWDVLRQPEMARIARLVHTEIGNFPELARFYFDEVILPVRRLLHRILERGVERGELRRVNRDVVCRAIASLVVHGAMHQRFFGGHDPRALTDDQMIDGVLDLVFHGLLKDAAPAEAA